MSYSDDDMIMLYGVQSYAFCKRQFALEFIEQIEKENYQVVAGRVFHEGIDTSHIETRKDIHIATSLKLSSVKYGITGIADVVEFHQTLVADSADKKCIAVTLPKRSHFWRPVPVEYKRGKPKAHRADEVQLCAQALCLEEMLGVHIPVGALFYGTPRRRTEVQFDDTLRALTLSTITAARALLASGITPPALYTKACEACSLKEICCPQQLAPTNSARKWLDEKLREVL